MAGDPDRIRRNISHFSFDNCTHGSQGFSRILIQLFGFSGHGKSAFINSCMYVWEDGNYKNHTSSANNYGGQTLERRSYPLTEAITLVDNRGFGIIGGYETGEIFAQLSNLLPLDKPVEWTKKCELINKINEAKNSISVSDFVVPVLVYSIRKLLTLEEEGELKAVLQISQTLTGMFPFVVLTNKTHGELTKRESTFRSMGVDRIFSIENYTPEDHARLRGKHEVILKFLHEVVKEVQFQLEKPRNPEREMRRRRRYVKMYVKEREKIYREEASNKRKLLEKYKKTTMTNDPPMDLDHKREKEQLLEEDIRRMQEMMSFVDVEEEPIYVSPIDVMNDGL